MGQQAYMDPGQHSTSAPNALNTAKGDALHLMGTHEHSVLWAV